MAKLRLEITKGEEIRYISHLDYAGALERAIRRAKLPAMYSEGFNPHMKLAFASALAVGVTSEAEYLDVELTGEIGAAVLQNRLSASLPQGILIKRAQYMPDRSPALMAVVNMAEYKVTAPILPGNDFAKIEDCIRLFNAASEVLYTKESPKGKREINIKQYIFSNAEIIRAQEMLELKLAIRVTPTGSVKPGEVLTALVNLYGLPVDKNAALIHRTGLYVTDKNLRLSPLEL